MTIYNLPASSKERNISFTIPPELDAYFVELYQVEKKEDETPEEFSMRTLVNLSIEEFAKKKSRTDRQIMDANEVQNFEDAKIFKTDNGL